jgi:hypothetical protein
MISFVKKVYRDLIKRLDLRSEVANVVPLSNSIESSDSYLTSAIEGDNPDLDSTPQNDEEILSSVEMKLLDKDLVAEAGRYARQYLKKIPFVTLHKDEQQTRLTLFGEEGRTFIIDHHNCSLGFTDQADQFGIFNLLNGTRSPSSMFVSPLPIAQREVISVLKSHGIEDIWIDMRISS